MLYLLLLLCHIQTDNSLLLRSTFRRSPYRLLHGSDKLDTFRELRSEIWTSDGGNATDMLKNLIRLGDEWWAGEEASIKEINVNVAEDMAEFTRVPGCLSTVYVNINVQPDQTVTISGMADSRIARGMLALFVKALRGWSPASIASLSYYDVAAEFKFDVLLPPGRLNGFQNILATIQSQVAEKISLLSLISPLPLLPTEKDDGEVVISENKRSITTSTSISSSISNNSSNSRNVTDPRAGEVAVLLSGGVDSSVALQLLLQRGAKVRAYYLKIWLEDEVAHLNECPWEEDLSYATAICEQLHVPLETLSLQREYWDSVVQYTFDEAKRGRTPNPDIMCNSRIKFGIFYDYIGRFHSKIATGHYAQVLTRKQMRVRKLDMDMRVGVENGIKASSSSSSSSSIPTEEDGDEDNEEVCLVQSPDATKDQTYFLCRLKQEQLRRCVFPIGHLQKPDVRRLAEQFDLPTKARKDSQGICFLGKVKFDDFIGNYLGECPGDMRDYRTGEVVGRHKGLWFHTIGQRKGIGLLLHPGRVHLGPWFVAAKDLDSNTVFVTNDLAVIEAPRLSFVVEDVSWIRHPVPFSSNSPIKFGRGEGEGEGLGEGEGAVLLEVKLRHGPTTVQGWVRRIRPAGKGEGETATETLQVDLLQKDRGGIAPGQYAAFYRNGECVGAGVIADVGADAFPPSLQWIGDNLLDVDVDEKVGVEVSVGLGVGLQAARAVKEFVDFDVDVERDERFMI